MHRTNHTPRKSNFAISFVSETNNNNNEGSRNMFLFDKKSFPQAVFPENATNGRDT